MTVHTKIAAAFVAAQADLRAVHKDATNPHFKSAYVSLDAIVEALRPVLAAHGLGVMQTTELATDGKTLVVHTTVIHESGEVLGNSVPVPIVKVDAQGVGSALTYGRRYALAAMFCMAADDDDDGNAASRAPQARKTAPRPSDGPPPSERATGHSSVPADRIFKGKRIGDVPTPDLEKILKWARNHDAPLLAEDIGVVLADRSLGLDADGQVARMKAAVDKEDAELPFK